MVPTSENQQRIFAESEIPLGMLSSYLFFLTRRPISNSNLHFLARRIEGLKSLGPVLATSGAAQVREIAVQLREMRAANFSTSARELQFRLAMLHKPRPVPADYLVSSRPPGPQLFANARRILLALCPAIGVGDEIIFFPLPRWIKATNREASITVMSGYDGLWDRVQGIDAIRYYSGHRDLLEILKPSDRKEAADFDLVIFADFEKPGLAPLVCREPSVRRYIEISLGAQAVSVVDNQARCLRSTSLLPEAQISYYDGFDQLFNWLGGETNGLERYDRNLEQRKHCVDKDSLKVFVSPFTSKYNPSLIYWSRVLASLSEAGPDGRVSFLLDPGITGATERFSSALLLSARAHSAPNTTFSLAGDRSRGLPLSEVFTTMENCHAVLCADSFAAHAAPLFGCTTLVIASAGLEGWRTPSVASYYFDISQRVDEMTSAMREILTHIWGGPSGNLGNETDVDLDQDALQLDDASCRLDTLLGVTTQNNGELIDAYSDLRRCYTAAIPKFRKNSKRYAAFLNDVDYDRAWRELELSGTDPVVRDSLEHLRAEACRWRNTNLRKLLRHLRGSLCETEVCQ